MSSSGQFFYMMCKKWRDEGRLEGAMKEVGRAFTRGERGVGTAVARATARLCSATTRGEKGVCRSCGTGGGPMAQAGTAVQWLKRGRQSNRKCSGSKYSRFTAELRRSSPRGARGRGRRPHLGILGRGRGDVIRRVLRREWLQPLGKTRVGQRECAPQQRLALCRAALRACRAAQPRAHRPGRPESDVRLAHETSIHMHLKTSIHMHVKSLEPNLADEQRAVVGERADVGWARLERGFVRVLVLRRLEVVAIHAPVRVRLLLPRRARCA
jgi:hypothetical protein